MKKIFISAWLPLLAAMSCSEKEYPIDREALVRRNNPVVTEVDELSSLSVGNGSFAFTVDATGLQTFPEHYSPGVPLGTQSEWGWHCFPNPLGLTHDEVLGDVELFGRHGLYAIQFSEPERKKEASEWFRVNPHRLHLGTVGLELVTADGNAAVPADIRDIGQQLDMWSGTITSEFSIPGNSYRVTTVCDPGSDMIAASVSTGSPMTGGVNFRFPYPTGQHSDDGCDWNSPGKHKTEIADISAGRALLRRTLDETVYYVEITWERQAEFTEKEPHYFLLTPQGDDLELSFTCGFYTDALDGIKPGFDSVSEASRLHWQNFWQSGGAVDFSQCTDGRAAELERRVVLSQYLTAIQCTGSVPPQESGLTYNTWFGRSHLEMHWWHGVHFPLWGRPELLERSLPWYQTAYPHAVEIARRQGFDGARWMKMTDPWAGEAPSNVGSFLIWQQPHFIYFAELMYRADPSPETVEKYKDLVFATADFMYSFADYDAMDGRFVLQGMIPAQETLRASVTVNPPLELSYWHYAMETAQNWRVRAGLRKNLEWEELIDKLSPLAYNDEGLYLAAETATDTYIDVRFTSDHMAVLGALGMLPKSKLVREDYMENTLEWIWENWNWGKTWGWDFPMTAMNAARLGRTDLAVGALLMDKRTNTYLVNGHNYQDKRLRIYMPGNGGLLTAVAMMCAGWDGSPEGVANPGFPKDGKWDVRWEGLEKMP